MRFALGGESESSGWAAIGESGVRVGFNTTMSTTNVVCIPPLPHGALDTFTDSTRECIERLMKSTPERYDLSVSYFSLSCR